MKLLMKAKLWISMIREYKQPCRLCRADRAAEARRGEVQSLHALALSVVPVQDLGQLLQDLLITDDI